jgi:hypothetical protein
MDKFIKDKKVLEIIRERLTIREEEKELYGEVFTPLELIIDMFSQLPDDIWQNTELKWLDPASGIGNFLIVVYYKLMDSLKPKILDDKQRSKHIIENMLYMVELNSTNFHVCNKIFKMINPDAIPNIVECDFLNEFNPNKIFNIDKFNLIVGNPPFHKKVGPNKKQKIWHFFVIDSINKYLNDSGYLVFVHPNGWRDIKGDYIKVLRLIKSRELLSLTMRDYKDGVLTFGGSATNYDYYCLKNTLNDKNLTLVNDIDHKSYILNLNNYDFIPSGKFEIFEKILGKGCDKVELLYSSIKYETRGKPKSNYEVIKISKPGFEYKIINTITKKRGPQILYSNARDDVLFVPKVVWSNGTGTYPFIDIKGEYGLTQFSYGIKDVPDNLHKIKMAMETDDFIQLMKYLMGRADKYKYKIIGTFKKDFYEYFLEKDNKI